MNYKESLEEFKKTKLDLLKVNVAEEVQSSIDIEVTDDDFENICEFVQEMYFGIEKASVWQIACVTSEYLNEGTPVDELWDIDEYEFIDKINW